MTRSQDIVSLYADSFTFHKSFFTSPFTQKQKSEEPNKVPRFI